MKKINKAAFIRKYPKTSPALIVKLAQAKGIKLTLAYVYNVRATNNSKREKKLKKKPEPQLTNTKAESTQMKMDDLVSSFAKDTAKLVRGAVVALIDLKIYDVEENLSKLRKARAILVG